MQCVFKLPALCQWSPLPRAEHGRQTAAHHLRIRRRAKPLAECYRPTPEPIVRYSRTALRTSRADAHRHPTRRTSRRALAPVCRAAEHLRDEHAPQSAPHHHPGHRSRHLPEFHRLWIRSSKESHRRRRLSEQPDVALQIQIEIFFG